MFLKSSVSLKQEIKCDRIIDFIRILYTVDEHHRWRSVEEELPRQDEEVIVLCDDLNVAPNYKISFGHIVDKTICQDYNGWNIPNVVYWFPMPKLLYMNSN